MEILAWNCRGLNNDQAVEALQTLIRQKKPSFIFLSETKVHDREYMQGLRLTIGYRNCEAVFSNGQSGGVALFWEDGLDVRFLSKSRFHVDVEVRAVDGSGIRWRLTGFYGHPSAAERRHSWSLLRHLSDVSSLPWVVIGDFNEITSNEEKDGGNPRRESQMREFQAGLDEAELVDLGFFGAQFTWKGGGVRCRLDRAVASPSWLDLFSSSRVLHLPPIHGDHVPILLGAFLNPQTPRVLFRKRFRFESFWTQHAGCQEVVEKGWSTHILGAPMFQAVQKITNTRLLLNNWQRSTFGNRKQEIELLRGRLQQLLGLPLSPAAQLDYSNLSLRLETLLEEEHAYWKQRSKVTWLKEGDRNTKFFHRKASNQRAKNRLQGLFDSNGVWKSSTDGMEQVILSYFSSMFTSESIDLVRMHSVVNLLQPRVTDAMNEELCAPYSDVEIRAALFQMYPTKSPGPDGMSPLFFQKYWDTIGSEVCAAVKNFLLSGNLLKVVNYTHVCLIPKVPHPKQVSDLRPIALCNVLYKICSKVIANRLKKHLSSIISPYQSAFIPGRLITDNSLVANEVSHFIENDVSEGVMSLKLDMSKAYDRMERVFLEAVLLRLGFKEVWVKTILQCVSTVRYSFMINGKPCGLLSPTRGLRQGDPLSPYLFLLGAEVFSALLEKKASQGLLQGVAVCDGAPIIHHLLFADDSLLFGKAVVEECVHIQDVLNDYAAASGQQINLGKSKVVFSKGVPVVLQSSLASIFGVSIVSKHEKYLGLPTVVGRNRTDTFSYIKEQLSVKLEGWQGKVLSGAGKDLLIRVVAQALPVYSMNCFLLPKSFCNSLHQMWAKFWWGSKSDGRKIHWMSWEKLCRPKEEGGMGFRDLYAHNLALLAKQAWRIVKHPTSLFSRLFKARYFPQNDFWSAPNPVKPSACWKGITEAYSLLVLGTRYQVGDGVSLNAWEDLWLPRPSSFLPLSRLSLRLSKVCDFINIDRSWNVTLLDEHFDKPDVSLILTIPLSHRQSDDTLIWHYDKKGKFSSKSAYSLAIQMMHSRPSSSEVGSSAQFWKKIWFAKVPGKVKVHIWRVCSSILPTIAALRDKHVFINNGCFFCNSEDETIDHVSRDCCFVKDFIKLFPELRNVLHLVTQSTSVLDWLMVCSESLTKELFSLLLVILWSIWKERNKRVWSDNWKTLHQLHFQTRSYVCLVKSMQPSLNAPHRRIVPWSPPSAGWLKANIDGAFVQASSCGGVGVVVRDHSGSIVGGTCFKVHHVISPDLVEALAGRAACELALQFHMDPIILESDCSKLVHASASLESDYSGFGQIVSDIRYALSYLHSSSFVHVYRETNVIAHKVARLALSSNVSFRWFGAIPTELYGFLANICNP